MAGERQRITPRQPDQDEPCRHRCSADWHHDNFLDTTGVNQHHRDYVAHIRQPNPVPDYPTDGRGDEEHACDGWTGDGP